MKGDDDAPTPRTSAQQLPTMTAPRTQLVEVSLNRSRYRSGRWLLVAEGVACAAVGSAAAIGHLGGGSRSGTGISVFGLHISPVECVVLAVFGVLAVAAAFRRGTAVVLSAIGVAGGMTMVIVTSVAAVHDASGALGFEFGDILLSGLLGAYNLGLLMWLCSDAVEGRVWRYRHRSAMTGSSGRRRSLN
ncbi:hypothetical protein [Mycobacterium sp. 852014-52144_SCH5372336]|uniref:hypothetical protein n=1 Tax=Mycobacterium sp. 852014-52144_SCH5372336 TaxID=1834115 RepID=UPI0007FE4E2C|nr:hypothetical protein [Mycobacterium sp. 852014-52144_SCH5372336]OBB74152.1 hypothetical protein A5759_12980 [Mycobacterium sp. 852014-52144_SCH5372336]